jgi:ATP-dependent Clp protease adaptor protein ClpS
VEWVGNEVKEDVTSKTRKDTKEPPMFKVVLLNDDYTTMEFVVEILVYVFKRTPEDATRIMLQVHREGRGLCGVYTHEVAETKIDTVQDAARENGYPLQCTMEKE